jgi:chromosome segregation ATPase
MMMMESGVSETRQQIERWIEESQLLLGRIIPSVLDDNQRLRDKLAASEQDTDRLREEVAMLRREVVGLQSELEAIRGQYDFIKGEQAAMADSCTRALHHLNQMVQPINEMVAKLNVAQAPGLEGVLR